MSELGAGIGDGWTDPVNQLSEFGLFGYAMGLVDEEQRSQIELHQLDAVFNIHQGMEAIKNKEYDTAHTFMKPALDDFDAINDIITTAGRWLERL